MEHLKVLIKWILGGLCVFLSLMVLEREESLQFKEFVLDQFDQLHLIQRSDVQSAVGAHTQSCMSAKLTSYMGLLKLFYAIKLERLCQ